jgi:hypothetical protein
MTWILSPKKHVLELSGDETKELIFCPSTLIIQTLQTAPVTSLAEVKGKSFKWNVKPNPSIFSQLTGAEKNRSLRNAKKRQGKATAKTFGPMNGVGVVAAKNAVRLLRSWLNQINPD